MAVDAIDLVLAERPDVVVIASSDSDFAPLVQRLREKGCVVRGIGQLGKTGDETQEVYDDFTVLEHRKGAVSATAEKPKRAPRKTAAAKAPAAKKAPARKTAAAPATPPPAPAPAAKTPARKAPARKKAVPAPVPEADDDLPGAVVAMLEASASPSAAAPAPAPPAAGEDARPARGARVPSTLAAVLDCLPELQAGQSLALNTAVQRLRAAQLLGKSSSSLKLFSQLSDRFELLPPDKPAQVRLRR
jgi:hypothetical protein